MLTTPQPNPDRLRSEKILAGSMLLDARSIDAAIAYGVNPDTLADTTARAIIRTSITRHATGLPVDVLTVTADSGLPWGVIEECVDLVPTVAESAYYAQRVTRYADLDRFALIGSWIAAKIQKASPDDAPEIAAEISSAVERAIQAGRLMNASTLSEAAISWLDRMTADDQSSIMLDWPLDVLTQQMGRVDREIIWIMAQPSIGKTAFVLQWLLTLAMQGHTVSLASLESGADSVGSRAISQMTPMNNYAIRQRRAGPEQIKQAYETAKRIPDTLRITDGSMTLDQLCAWGKSEARKGSKLIVVDNTRHIRVPGFATDRINATAEISTRMKQMRDDTGIPVCILHHTTIDKKTGKETASWSSDIRKDADIMITLSKDANLTVEPQAVGDNGIHCVRFCVDKNREAPAEYDILMRFRKEIQLFERWLRDYKLGEDDDDTPAEY